MTASRESFQLIRVVPGEPGHEVIVEFHAGDPAPDPGQIDLPLLDVPPPPARAVRDRETNALEAVRVAGEHVRLELSRDTSIPLGIEDALVRQLLVGQATLLTEVK